MNITQLTVLSYSSLCLFPSLINYMVMIIWGENIGSDNHAYILQCITHLTFMYATQYHLSTSWKPT